MTVKKKKASVKELKKELRQKEKKKMTSTKVILLGFILIMLILTGIFGYFLLFPEEEEAVGAVLKVDEVYFVTKELQGDKYTLETFVFITNNGDADCQVNIRAFAINVDTNLAMDEASEDVGSVEAQKTKETSFTVDVPKDGKYRVELLIFKNDKVTVKGSGTVNLDQAGAGGEDYQTVESEEPPADKKKARAPTILNFLGVSLVIATYVVYRRRRGRR